MDINVLASFSGVSESSFSFDMDNCSVSGDGEVRVIDTVLDVIDLSGMHLCVRQQSVEVELVP